LSKLCDRSHRHDVFHRRAKQQGFVARSVFKLEEIDQKYRLLRRGGRVLDLGCRPGSWLQYASGIVGPDGALVGIDRTPLDKPVPGARNGYVVVRNAKKKAGQKVKLRGQVEAEVKSKNPMKASKAGAGAAKAGGAKPAGGKK